MHFAVLIVVFVFGTTVNALPAADLADFNAKVVAQIENPALVTDYSNLNR